MRVVVLCLPMVVGAGAHASELVGVPRIVDADTVYLGEVRVRLEGVDAPEMDQRCLDAAGAKRQCGIEARSALEAFAGGHPWTCLPSGRDRYGRVLAHCSVNGEDVGGWLGEQWAGVGIHENIRRPISLTRAPPAKMNADSGKALSSPPGIGGADLQRPSFLAQPQFRSKVITLLGVDATQSPPEPSCVIKANLHSASRCIYHLPGGHFYDRLSMKDNKARRWFCSEAEALAAGCRASKR